MIMLKVLSERYFTLNSIACWWLWISKKNSWSTIGKMITKISPEPNGEDFRTFVKLKNGSHRTAYWCFERLIAVTDHTFPLFKMVASEFYTPIAVTVCKQAELFKKLLCTPVFPNLHWHHYFNVSFLVSNQQQQQPPPEVMDEKDRAKLKKAVMFMTEKDKTAKDYVRSAFRKVLNKRNAFRCMSSILTMHVGCRINRMVGLFVVYCYAMIS